jgi:hypothetical protein
MKHFGSATRNGGLLEGKGSDIIRNLSGSQPSRGLRRGASGTNDEPFNGPSFNTEQKLSDGGLKPLADLIGLLGLGYRFAGDAVLHGADPSQPSPAAVTHPPWIAVFALCLLRSL